MAAIPGPAILAHMNRFSIRDIENLTGVKAHTIRIWEQRYGILTPKRTSTNIRYYDAEDLKMALRVALLNNFGYKISRIHQMTDVDMSSLIQKISDVEFRMMALTNELLEATLRMDTTRFEQLLNNFITRHGIERTIEELIFQFLEKVGILWMTSRLAPAQEHLVSNILFRKLAVAIEKLPLPEAGRTPCAMLYLPEGEIHEISLLYVYYMLRKQGKNVIYLGANSPVREVQLVYEAKRPDYIYTHLTSTAHDFDLAKYVKRLNELMPDADILMSGAMLREKKGPRPANIRFLHSLAEVREAIETMRFSRKNNVSA